MGKKALKAKLTEQEKTFVKVKAKTGNGTLAAKKAFGIDDPNYAGVKAHELLRIPKIVNALDKVLSDENLSKVHQDLFEQKRVDYFVFPKKMEDEEIVEHVASVGIKVITVRESDKGKMAFYAVPDGNVIKGALDMGYKIRGRYAPDKSINVNILATVAPEEREKLEEVASKSLSEIEDD